MNKLRKISGLVMLAIFLLVSGAEAATISSCRTISAPGTYTLTKNLIGMTGNPCITITSSDVTIDGAGHLLDGQNSGTGILAFNPQTALTNVNVKNLIITDWTYGIHYQATVLSTLSNNDIRTSSYGFVFDQYSGRNKFINNKATSNSYGFYISTGYNNFIGNKLNSNSVGIYLQGSDHNILNDNIGTGNTGSAIYLGSSEFNTLRRNKATCFATSYCGTGIDLGSSDNNTLDNNKAATYYGFSLSSSDHNTLINNNATGVRGFDFSSSNNNSMNNNIANVQQYGIILNSANYNKITRTTTKGVSQYGLSISSSNNNKIYDNLFSNTNNLFLSNSKNIWNIPPKQSAINIVNGLYTAGNVWENPTKTGFSQICNDADRNGICDSANTLEASNIDFKPLVHHADTTKPKTVTNLHNTTYQRNYIKWAWTDPTDSDFSYVKVYIDGKFKAGVLHGVKTYSATGLLPNTLHTIGIRTIDINGNENPTTITKTARTKP